MGLLRHLPPDGRILFLTRGLRAVAYGFIAVMLALYLAERGLTSADIGTLFSAALISGAVFIIAITAVADRFGRRRTLVLGALLMAATGVAFALSANPTVLMAAAVLGIITPNNQEVGPFLSLEQAILPQIAGAAERTSLFAWYNGVGSLAGALGALLAAAPAPLQRLGFTTLASYQTLLGLYAAIGLAMALLFWRLSPAAEAPALDGGQRTAKPSAVRRPPSAWLGIGPSRGIVLRLCALFAVDSFAGGLAIQSLLAYWLNVRFGAGPGLLGATFFAVNLLAALSFVVAARLARRFGLLNTMVFTHLPGNFLLILLPFVPALPAALAILFARGFLSQMDIPTRQSYTMAVVTPAERTATAGLTGVARNLGSTLAPATTGAAFNLAAYALPFVFAGVLKIAYDLTLLVSFRAIRPPEEVRTSP
jgi:MFS family permease